MERDKDDPDGQLFTNSNNNLFSGSCSSSNQKKDGTMGLFGNGFKFASLRRIGVFLSGVGVFLPQPHICLFIH